MSQFPKVEILSPEIKCLFVDIHSVHITVRKFQDFCITEILREINFMASRSAKTTVFAILWALKFANLVNFCL